MQLTGPPVEAPPATPEEAVIALLMQAGRKLRTRHPEDSVDPSSFPLVKTLMCGAAMRVSDLAAKVELDASTVSRQIKQLEDKGIIERATDPADARASLVRLTVEGEAQMQAALKRRFLRIKAAVDPWSDKDKAILTRLLTRLAADLRDTDDQAAADDATPSSATAKPRSPDPSTHSASTPTHDESRSVPS